jgi:2'-5' RNA ligase superfamily
VPAHVTICVPFAPLPDVTGLADLAAGIGALRVRFASLARFPGVLYAEPDPGDPFRALTRALARRWPEYPPYGGQFGDDVIPHLTIAESADPGVLAEASADVEPRLPVETVLTAASLLVFGGSRWNVVRELPFEGLTP